MRILKYSFSALKLHETSCENTKRRHTGCTLTCDRPIHETACHILERHTYFSRSTSLLAAVGVGSHPCL